MAPSQQHMVINYTHIISDCFHYIINLCYVMKSAGRIRKLDRILEISQIVQCNLQIGQIGRLDGTYTASHKKEFWQGSGHSYLVYSDLTGCANGSRYQNTAKSGVLQVKA